MLKRNPPGDGSGENRPRWIEFSKRMAARQPSSLILKFLINLYPKELTRFE